MLESKDFQVLIWGFYLVATLWTSLIDVLSIGI